MTLLQGYIKLYDKRELRSRLTTSEAEVNAWIMKMRREFDCIKVIQIKIINNVS